LAYPFPPQELVTFGNETDIIALFEGPEVRRALT
jgi:hypothetical protein